MPIRTLRCSWPNGCATRSSALRIRAGLCALLLLGGAAAAGAPDAHVPLRVGSHIFHVEVAATPPQRALGLMRRTHLARDAGMLFVFEQKGRHCFWMKNTLVPLSIAFLADDGTIVELKAMQPRTQEPHCPTAPVRYALEVLQGEFENTGIKPGMRVSGGPFSARR